MRKTTTSLVLVLLLVAILLNGDSVEGEGRGSPAKKDDGNFKSQKSWKCIDCMILHGMCLKTPYLWPVHNKFCSSIGRTNVAPKGRVAPKLESDIHD
ncbi:hypothetical protein RYX36_029777 [Vicia faba]